MRRLIQAALTLLLSAALCACAGRMIEQEGIHLAGGLTYSLQPPPPQLTGRGTLEQLQIQSLKGQKQLLLQSEFDGDKLSMVGLDPSGLVLFELSWQALEDYRLERRIPLGAFEIEQILAYYQLSNWPTEVTKNGLRGGRLEENRQGRRLYQDDQLIFTLYEKSGIKHFLHHQHNYQITIKPVRTWQLDE